MWLAAEEEGFGRTLTQGLQTLRGQIEQARAAGRATVPADEVFRLHDTYGFPYEMTSELLAEEGLAIEGDFERLMDEQRARSRAGGARARRGRRRRRRGGGSRAQRAVRSPARAASRRASPATRPSASRRRSGARRAQLDGGVPGEARRVALLRRPAAARSPTSARSSASDGDCRARVQDVFRLGDDQALSVVHRGGRAAAGRAGARARRSRARATRPSATTPPRTCCRRRCASAWAATSARPAPTSAPTSCASTSATGRALSAEELRDVEDRVNEWIARNDPVRPITTTLDEAQAARRDGAVRREVRRGRAHGRGRRRRVLARAVRRHARALDRRDRARSGSSARPRAPPTCAASRRSPGPAAVELLREHDRLLERGRGRRCAPVPRRRRSVRPDARAGAQGAREGAQERRRRRRRRRRSRRRRPRRRCARTSTALGARERRRGARRARRCSTLADRLKGKLASAAIVLGTAADGRVHLVVSVAPALVERGVKAGDVVKLARGGRRRRRRRARHAGAGRRPRPGEARRGAIDGGARRRSPRRSRRLMRVLALDYGSARCGCAVSDPTGTIVTPIEPVAAPGHTPRAAALARARAASARSSASSSGCRCRCAARTPSRRARRASSPSASAGASARACRSSCTTSASRRAWPSAWTAPASASEDSRAAAHLLESWLAAQPH